MRGTLVKVSGEDLAVLWYMVSICAHEIHPAFKHEAQRAREDASSMGGGHCLAIEATLY